MARRIAASAERSLVKTYARLRELTQDYSFLLDSRGRFSVESFASPAFPRTAPSAPEDRMRHVLKAVMESFMCMEKVLKKRKPLADALRKAIHEAIYPMVGQAGAVLSPYFVQSTPVGRALVAWEHAEAEADCDAYLAEFDQRLAASGQSWGIWDKYSFHVRFMLSGFDISDRLTAGFKAQLERAAAYIEQRRVPQ